VFKLTQVKNNYSEWNLDADWLRIIGDVHGKVNKYANLCQTCPTIQVGDLGVGFPGDPINWEFMRGNQDMFIRGNHDNPEVCKRMDGYLGDFGTIKTPLGLIFYVSGANSIDSASRSEWIDWWREEELSIGEAYELIERYEEVADDVWMVISHDCPDLIRRELYQWGNASLTNTVLEEMLRIKTPKEWIFGHHHRDLAIVRRGCKFLCLDELHTIDIKLKEN
jgi:hypothetical protein